MTESSGPGPLPLRYAFHVTVQGDQDSFGHFRESADYLIWRPTRDSALAKQNNFVAEIPENTGHRVWDTLIEEEL